MRPLPAVVVVAVVAAADEAVAVVVAAASVVAVVVAAAVVVVAGVAVAVTAVVMATAAAAGTTITTNASAAIDTGLIAGVLTLDQKIGCVGQRHTFLFADFPFRRRVVGSVRSLPAICFEEGGPKSQDDRHVIVVQEGSGTLFELYKAVPNADSSWNAVSSAHFAPQQFKQREVLLPPLAEASQTS
jgi:hypothetical protein